MTVIPGFAHMSDVGQLTWREDVWITLAAALVRFFTHSCTYRSVQRLLHTGSPPRIQAVGTYQIARGRPPARLRPWAPFSAVRAAFWGGQRSGLGLFRVSCDSLLLDRKSTV